jgi:nucleotide-binding universal stress UspA family protein
MSDPVYYASVENMPIMGLTDSLGTNPLQFDPDNMLKEVSQHFLDKIKVHLGDYAINTVLKEGDFAETILNSANKIHADLIVLGSHSRKWLDDVLLGSVTNQVLRQTHRPLFIVPTKKQD